MINQQNMNKLVRKYINMHKIIAISFVFFPFYAHSAQIDENKAENSVKSPLSPLYECAKIKIDSERLQCFDKVVANIAIKEEKNEVFAIDAPKLKEIRKEAFGFKLPSLPKLEMPKIGKEEKEVEEKQIMIANRLGRFGGKYAIYMENGQIWQFIDSDEPNLPKDPPLNVSIRTATMGSYILSFEGRNKGYRVRRVE